MPYDASDSLQAVSAGIGGVTALGSAWEQATALRAQGEFQVSMARINQQFASIQADEVIRQGDYQANQIRKKGEKTVGSQRAAAAAQGLDVNDSQGSAFELVDDTKLQAAQDIAQAHTNAWMQAWGIKTQATLNVDTAQSNKSGADFAANQTLLTGGLQAASAAAKIGSIYAKSGTKAPTTQKDGSYSGQYSPGQLLDRSIYGTPNPAPRVDSTNFAGNGWWQNPSKDEP